jgi:hypothetical protein
VAELALLGKLLEARVEPRLHVPDLGPEGPHVDDEVLQDRHVPHGRDHRDVAALGEGLHARLAGEHGGPVHPHPAGAADHHPAALAVGERAVHAVLDQVEDIEERRPLGRVDLEGLEVLLARLGVVAPDLEGQVH